MMDAVKNSIELKKQIIQYIIEEQFEAFTGHAVTRRYAARPRCEPCVPPLQGQNIVRRRLVQRAMPLVARVAASSDGFRGHQSEGFHADDDRRLLRGRQR